MPRSARKKSRSGVYHIMLRGVNRQTIFEDDEDKSKFLETLKKYKDISKYHLYSYCLMDNHVHLLVRESEETISEAIKRISSSYVYWYNLKKRDAGTGPLTQQSETVDGSLLALFQCVKVRSTGMSQQVSLWMVTEHHIKR